MEFWPSILHIRILISSSETLEMWPYYYKHWYFCLIPLLQSLEFWLYPSNHCNCGLNFIHIGILMSSIQLFFFWPYTHWHSYPFLLNVGIRTLFLYTLEFYPQPSKDWNSAPIFVNIGILILFPPPPPANVGILALFL